jgi:hypothetical protein
MHQDDQAYTVLHMYVCGAVHSMCNGQEYLLQRNCKIEIRINLMYSTVPYVKATREDR